MRAAVYAVIVFSGIVARSSIAEAASPPSVVDYALNVTINPSSLDVDAIVQMPPAPAIEVPITFRTTAAVKEITASQIVTNDEERPLRLSQTVQRHRETWTADGIVVTGAPVRLHFVYRVDGGPEFVYYVRPGYALADGDDTAWYPQFGDERGIGSMVFKAPAGDTVAATGTEVETAADRGNGVFRFNVEAPSPLAFVAAPFSVVSAAEDPNVQGYQLHTRPNSQAYLDRCETVLRTLEREFGPDPFHHLKIVEIPDADADRAGFGGAGTAGMIIVTSSFLDAPFNTAYFGHETSHQWWGDAIDVANGGDEPMAQFGSLLAVRAIDGDAVAEHYSKYGYPGYIADQSAQGYFEFLEAGIDQPLENLSVGISAHDIGDSKGFLVVDLLADETGRVRFGEQLSAFTRSHAFSKVSLREILEAASRGGPVDFNGFWKEWFERTGAPSFALHWMQRGRTVLGEIRQVTPYYTVSVPIGLVLPDGKIMKRTVWLRNERTTFRVDVPRRVSSIILDPHYAVLRHTPEFDARGQAFANDTRGMHALSFGQDALAISDLEAALKQPPMPGDREVKFFANYWLGFLAANKGDWTPARQYMERAADDRNADPQWLPYVFLTLVKANVALGDRAAANVAADRALEADNSIHRADGIAGAVRSALDRPIAPPKSPAQ